MVSVLFGDGPMSIVAEAPLTVIAPTGYNNTANIAFALVTTMGPAVSTSVSTAQTHNAATLMASKIVDAQSLLDAMTAASDIENAHFTTAPLPNVATSAARFPPNTYYQNEEDFVASLLTSGVGRKNEDTTPAGGGEKTGVASSAGGLDEDMELHYYRSHKASFNMQAFPPGKVNASNTKFKPKI